MVLGAAGVGIECRKGVFAGEHMMPPAGHPIYREIGDFLWPGRPPTQESAKGKETDKDGMGCMLEAMLRELVVRPLQRCGALPTTPRV